MTRRVLVLTLATAALLAGCSVPDATLPADNTVNIRAQAPSAAPVAVTPTRVRIPSIGVDSTLDRTGLDAAGALVVPDTAGKAAWYGGSPVPGDVGPAVLIGHVDLGGQSGVFARLDELVVGDEVLVDVDLGGVPARFTVTGTEVVDKDTFPSARVYGDTAAPELRLITCTGDLERRDGARHYADNLVVYATAAAR